MELENFPDKSLFFSPCHETRKRFFTITYCSRWDLSRSLSSQPTLLLLPIPALPPSSSPFPSRPPFFARFTVFSFFLPVDIQDGHSRAFEIAVSIKSVMGRCFSLYPAGQWAYVPILSRSRWTWSSCGICEKFTVRSVCRNRVCTCGRTMSTIFHSDEFSQKCFSRFPQVQARRKRRSALVCG